ncbi:Hok/Gef family protein [Atlantibacter hermannii]|nr:Hok/Gef family protein [Atlantibacter hermannii]
MNNIRTASYLSQDNEKKAMKQPRNARIRCVFRVYLTPMIFTYLTRSSLCDLRLKDGSREVAALLAYEPGK